VFTLFDKPTNIFFSLSVHFNPPSQFGMKTSIAVSGWWRLFRRTDFGGSDESLLDLSVE